jgi:hypothetical protein
MIYIFLWITACYTLATVGLVVFFESNAASVCPRGLSRTRGAVPETGLVPSCAKAQCEILR